MLLERDGSRFRSPSDFPPLSLACVTSHDLPTFAGWWSGADIAERVALGAIRDEGAAASDREGDKAALMERLEPVDAGDLGSVNTGVHAALADGNSALVMIQSEELVLEDRAVNMPGTDQERPNWRRRLRVPVAELFQGAGAAVLAAIKGRRRKEL
jgi:glycogen operon protein